MKAGSHAISDDVNLVRCGSKQP